MVKMCLVEYLEFRWIVYNNLNTSPALKWFDKSNDFFTNWISINRVHTYLPYLRLMWLLNKSIIYLRSIYISPNGYYINGVEWINFIICLSGVCRVLAQDHTSIFTWKCKIELEDHAKLSAYWPWSLIVKNRESFTFPPSNQASGIVILTLLVVRRWVF